MFYDRIKKVCDDRGIKLTPLIKELGMSQGNISRWKNGGAPSIEVLDALSVRLEVSADYLLEKTDDPTPADKKNTPLEHLDSKEALRQALIKKGIIPADRDLTEEESETLLSIAASYIKNKGTADN